jgi:hypothetical protein
MVANGEKGGLMVKRQPQTQDKYIVRLPDGMREQIESAARQSGRSMNAEIVLRLTKSFEDDERAVAVTSKTILQKIGGQAKNALVSRVDELAARVDAIDAKLVKAGL